MQMKFRTEKKEEERMFNEKKENLHIISLKGFLQQLFLMYFKDF